MKAACTLPFLLSSVSQPRCPPPPHPRHFPAAPSLSGMDDTSQSLTPVQSWYGLMHNQSPHTEPGQGDVPWTQDHRVDSVGSLRQEAEGMEGRTD